jgi:AcrR family transcriptional regulator
MTQRAGGSPPRRPGRPRRPDVETVVLEATISLLTERGLEGTTMSAVVERSGVARATVYLRWPNRQALIASAVMRAAGRPILDSTGDLEADLRRMVDRMGDVLGSAMFRAVFPALVAAVTPQADAPGPLLSFESMAPGLPVIEKSYRDYAGSQGFRTDVPPGVVADLIVGAHFGHYIITGRPPTASVRDQLLDAVLEGLRRRS